MHLFECCKTRYLQEKLQKQENIQWKQESYLAKWESFENLAEFSVYQIFYRTSVTWIQDPCHFTVFNRGEESCVRSQLGVVGMYDVTYQNSRGSPALHTK